MTMRSRSVIIFARMSWGPLIGSRSHVPRFEASVVCRCGLDGGPSWIIQSRQDGLRGDVLFVVTVEAGPLDIERSHTKHLYLVDEVPRGTEDAEMAYEARPCPTPLVRQ